MKKINIEEMDVCDGNNIFLIEVIPKMISASKQKCSNFLKIK